MTECERIVKQGILPESFFKEEGICDFLVTENRKKIWAIVLDLLIKFDEVCRMHSLRYFLAFGSLLGAVRHNGFIPWDDDIDVCMLRSDYDKLCELRDEFVNPYFLQLPGKDNDYWFTFAKLRNSNTSAVSRTFRYSKFNQGIALDIFPLDNCKGDELETYFLAIRELILENSANMRRKNPNPSKSDIERCSCYPVSNPQDVNDRIESIARKYQNEETKYVTCATMTIYQPRKVTFRRQDVTEIIDADFYGYKISIPRNFRRILETTYGDYMQFPPIEKRGLWHDGAIFDPDIPYIEVLQELRENDKICV
jgi:lipopolysaccharide cholinephosphotransferase